MGLMLFKRTFLLFLFISILQMNVFAQEENSPDNDTVSSQTDLSDIVHCDELEDLKNEINVEDVNKFQLKAKTAKRCLTNEGLIHTIFETSKKNRPKEFVRDYETPEVKKPNCNYSDNTTICLGPKLKIKSQFP